MVNWNDSMKKETLFTKSTKQSVLLHGYIFREGNKFWKDLSDHQIIPKLQAMDWIVKCE